MKSLDYYEIRIFDICRGLNDLKANKVTIYNLHKTDAYTYQFLASPYCRNRIKKVFVNPKIIKKVGLFHVFENFFKFKTTLIALVFSIALFFLYSNRIWKIEIFGNAKQLYPMIQETLKKNHIQVGMSKMNDDALLVIEEKMLYELKDKVEWLELRKHGSTITAKFLIKRTLNPPILLNNSLYATKDGVICAFDIKNGEKMVKINDYVKKGDLLVRDVVTTDQNQDVYVGTYGAVYAYTWYIVDLTYTMKEAEIYDEVSIFTKLLIQARSDISKNFDKNESIHKENVLKFIKEGRMIHMRVHFTCIENITKE